MGRSYGVVSYDQVWGGRSHGQLWEGVMGSYGEELWAVMGRSYWQLRGGVMGSYGEELRGGVMGSYGEEL